MLKKLSEEVRDCYARAEACASKAKRAVSEEVRADLRRLEKSWRILANSYEIAARLVDFTSGLKRQSEEWRVVEKAQTQRRITRARFFADDRQFVRPIRCSQCGQIAYLTRRSPDASGLGAVLRMFECQRCGHQTQQSFEP